MKVFMTGGQIAWACRSVNFMILFKKTNKHRGF
jgi:hypothetical protein